jgi:hypothetical protein
LNDKAVIADFRLPDLHLLTLGAQVLPGFRAIRRYYEGSLCSVDGTVSQTFRGVECEIFC